MPGMPTVIVICIWLSLPGYRLAERRVCPEYLPPLWEQRGKQFWKLNLDGEWERNLCRKNPLKIHSFILYHTNCLFCPWAQQQSLLFTEDIATGICACWQSIGGFERKAITLFGENGLACLYISHNCECSWPHFVKFSVVSMLKDTWSIFR